MWQAHGLLDTQNVHRLFISVPDEKMNKRW